MRLRLLAVALFLTVLAVQAEATVLIYSGKATRFTTRTTPANLRLKCYIAIDSAAKQAVVLTYGTVEGEKKQDGGSTYTFTTVAPFTRDDGRIESAFATVEKILAPITGEPIGAISLFLHGVQKELIVEAGNGTTTTAKRRQLLKGSSREILAFFGRRFVEDNFTAKYDQERSVQANLAGKTLSQVRTDLIALLAARGF
jgi:hypothetical protein